MLPAGRLCPGGFGPLAAHGISATLVIMFHGAAMAQIYTSGNASSDSSVVLSNFQTSATPVLLIAEPEKPTAEGAGSAAASKGSGAVQSATLRLPTVPPELQRMIGEVAAQVEIAPELLHAVIAAESNYNTRARSSRGAIGLMQLLPATALRFGVSDPYVARQNVLAGASYLKWLMALFQDDLELVLAAYNAGEQAVLRAGGRIPPYPETMAYVPKVMAYLRCARNAACKSA